MIEIPAEVPSWYDRFGAIVNDSINNRLILVNGDPWQSAAKNAWAIDLGSEQWTQILAPSTP